MQSFKDSTGTAWEVSISVNTVKRVRALLTDSDGKPLDLSRLLDDKCERYAALIGDVVLLVDALYVICKTQADAAGISDVQFGESLGGDSLERAEEAFREELICFFRVSKARESLRKMMAKSKEVGEKLLARAEAMLDKLDTTKEAETIAQNVITSLKPTQPTPAS